MSSAEPLPGYGVDDMRNLSAYFYEVTKMEFEAKFFACKFHFLSLSESFFSVFLEAKLLKSSLFFATKSILPLKNYISKAKVGYW